MAAVRPDPDALLARVQREEAKAKRGKLTVFFGATAGVGKTYAMLEDARTTARRRASTWSSATSSRTAAPRPRRCSKASSACPTSRSSYRGQTLRDFDLDAALARKPEVLLVDELAHSNPVEGEPTPRHAKRWQDVEELLAAGIDVYTTVNVQHVESLNDVVAGITGVRMQETVPDAVFERADEVVLIDTPPDELLERLHAGKVYIPEQARNAIENFFRKGNLIALRELALRTTADRVDQAMQRVPRRATASAPPGRRASACWWRSAPTSRASAWCAPASAWRRRCTPTGSWSTSRRRTCCACRRRSATSASRCCAWPSRSAPRR